MDKGRGGGVSIWISKTTDDRAADAEDFLYKHAFPTRRCQNILKFDFYGVGLFLTHSSAFFKTEVTLLSKV